VTAALGIACGLGAWPIVGISLVLALFLLVGAHWLERMTMGGDGEDHKID
jgi:putative Mg2+ transporter-C (MgtC) family protein